LGFLVENREPQGVQQKLNGGELRADASAPT